MRLIHSGRRTQFVSHDPIRTISRIDQKAQALTCSTASLPKLPGPVDAVALRTTAANKTIIPRSSSALCYMKRDGQLTCVLLYC